MKPLKRDPVGPGQESVWDYPRPPLLEPVQQRVRIEFGGQQICESTRALRILETSHPPTIYIPPDDFVDGTLVDANKQTFCEWKGTARYYDVCSNGQTQNAAAWYYPRPHTRYADLANCVSVYPSRMDAACLGAHVHGLAGDLAAEQKGQVSMVAADIKDCLHLAFRKLA